MEKGYYIAETAMTEQVEAIHKIQCLRERLVDFPSEDEPVDWEVYKNNRRGKLMIIFISCVSQFDKIMGEELHQLFCLDSEEPKLDTIVMGKYMNGRRDARLISVYKLP